MSSQEKVSILGIIKDIFLISLSYQQSKGSCQILFDYVQAITFVTEQAKGQPTLIEPNHFPLTIDGVVL